jgi:retron-type reverse transcriptase
VHRAWLDFSAGKRQKTDVIAFAGNIEDELCSLVYELRNETYVHGSYERFIVYDPKRRVIHKASVRDRIVHRFLYNALLPEFHRRWLGCSYSCRPGFGQHRSIADVRAALRQVETVGRGICWILKCDVRKFFDSVHHETLLELLCAHISDPRLCWLLELVVESFATQPGVGLPIGNLTSQLFANVYMHELDWFAKQTLGLRWYFRYADDMLVLHPDKEYVLEAVAQM